MKDYYYILGVKPESTQDDIKSAYRKLSIKFHPDKNDGDVFFSDRFKEIQEAWSVLGNPEKRYTYDNKRFDSSKTNNSPIPTIIYFKANKTTYDLNEEITFSWETSNADKVTLNPIGKVESIGTKIYRIKVISSTSIDFELVAENTSNNKTTTSKLTLTKKKYGKSTENTFQLYDYMKDNDEDIANILYKIAQLFSVIHTFIISFPLIKYCFKINAYEPITIKYLLYQLGSDWALFADWVYNPTNFITINTLFGWIFKIAFLIPSLVPIFYIIAFVYYIYLIMTTWVGKMVAKIFGSFMGIIAMVAIIILLLIGIF